MDEDFLASKGIFLGDGGAGIGLIFRSSRLKVVHSLSNIKRFLSLVFQHDSMVTSIMKSSK